MTEYLDMPDFYAQQTAAGGFNIIEDEQPIARNLTYVGAQGYLAGYLYSRSAHSPEPVSAKIKSATGMVLDTVVSHPDTYEE
jgi:hypothetical protein